MLAVLPTAFHCPVALARDLRENGGAFGFQTSFLHWVQPAPDHLADVGRHRPSPGKRDVVGRPEAVVPTPALVAKEKDRTARAVLTIGRETGRERVCQGV